MLSPNVCRVLSFVVLAFALANCSTSQRPQSVLSSAIQADGQLVIGPPARPGIDGPVPTTRIDTPAIMWGATPAATVTTAELMASGGAPTGRRPAMVRPVKLRPNRTALFDDPNAPAVGQWPPSPSFRFSGPATAFTLGAPNVDVATLVDTQALPPDTQGDVGPTQYLVGLNGRIRTINKSTGLADGVINVDSDLFFGSVAAGAVTTDPRVRYDRRSGRWLVLMVTVAVPNRYVLAVSNSSTITAGTVWSLHQWTNTRTQGGVGGAAPCLGDYPTLGVDEDALYVGANQFCGSDVNSLAFDSTSVYVINRANLVAGSPTYAQFDGVLPNALSPGPYAPQGVDNFDSGTNEGYVIGVDAMQYSLLVLRRIANPAGTPSISGNVNLPVPQTTSPITVPHPGSAIPLDALDDRLLNAVIRNGRLWTSHQFQVDSTGVASSVGGRNGTRWYEIQNLASAASLVQSGTVFDSAVSNPAHHWMSSVMVNGQGHVAMGMSKGGATTYVNTEFTGRLANAAPGTMEIPTQYSTNTSTPYTVQSSGARQRWGDYSQTSVDPTDDMTMWTLQEYPNAPNSYAVRLVRLQAPPPATILAVSPNSVASGQTGVSVTVAGASSSGSGFFDPGAGFANRIAAAFSGTGVTVTNVAVNTATSLTLTLSTAGASAGARTLTVSNGDGQQSSLTSALTITDDGTAPIAAGDSYNALFNTPLVVAAPGVLGNDNANGGGTLSAVIDTNPTSGGVTLNPNGSFAYTPAATFSGVASFTYRASTATGGLSSPATVTIAVATPSGTPPAFGIQPSDLRTYEGQSARFSVNISGTPLPTCQWQSSPDLGASWSNLSDGPLYSGVTTWFLHVTSTNLATSGTQFRCLGSNTAGSSPSNPATLSVGLMVAGAAPASGPWSGSFLLGGGPISFNVTAGRDIVGVTYSTTLACAGPVSYGPTVVAQSFSGNQFLLDGRTGCLAAASLSGAFNSATTAGGVIAYTTGPTCPCQNPVPTSWSASAGATTPQAPQFVSQPTNQPIIGGQKAQFTVAADGRPFAAYQWQLSTNGGVTWTDVPNASPYSGAATQTLTILASGAGGLNGGLFRARAQNASGTAFSNAALLGASPVSPPTVLADAYATPFQTALNVSAPGVLGNDNTNGGGPMTAQIVSSTSSGALTLSGNGSFAYTPNTAFSGGDSFTYRASNSQGPGNTVTVSITVGQAAGSLSPTPANDSYNTGHNAVLSVPAPGVLGNDNSNGGGVMSALLLANPTNGSLSFGADGSFSYTPTNGFSGVDTFSYRPSTVNGGAGSSATVSITVTPTGLPVPPSTFRILGMSGNSVTFAWTLLASGPNPTGIQLEGGLSPGSVLGALPLGVTPSATVALPSGSFYIRLRSNANGVLSSPSNELLVHVNVPVPPSPPANLLGAVNGSAVSLSWTPTFGGGAPSGAILDVTGSLSAALPLGSGDTFGFPAVPPGTYTFTVRQTNAAGSSVPSNGVTLSFPGGCTGVPQPAANFRAYKVGGALHLAWDPPVSGPAPVGYLLNVSGSFVGTFPMSGRLFSVLAPPGTFNLSIVASNGCGSGAPTAVQSVSFP